jgi:CheY-like chemotaxis protein/anti-sigma regulatory factor (Ser/Thr protein kinase)
MTKVLVVDDSAVDRRLAGSLLERNYRASVAYANDGQEAIDVLSRGEQFDIVVTDLQMPRVSGLELVVAIRKQFPLVPVVIMTAQGSEELAVEALQKGAAGYMAKTRLADELVEVVDNVLAVARADRRHGRLLDCLAEAEWRFVIENDTTLIPPLVDQVRQDLLRLQLCDETSLTRLGIAFHEALMNAVHHGNLEMKSDLREDDERKYHDLAAQRRTELPYRERRVEVQVRMNRDEAVYVIRDQGPGFDPGSLPDPTDPANMERVSGRGLLLVRTFMDEVRHNDRGNEITMIKRREE